MLGCGAHTSCGEARRRAAAWFFVALLLGERAIAVRTASEVFEEEDDDPDTSLRAPPQELEDVERSHPDQANALRLIKEQYAKGKVAEAEASCDQIRERMVAATQGVISYIHPACAAHVSDQCQFEWCSIDTMITKQGSVLALAAAADRKRCLPAVMGSPEMQERLAELLSILPRVFRSEAAEVGRARVREAYLQLVSFQEGVLALEQDMADRQMLLTLDIENNCPAPCRQCDRHDSAGFSFRCLLWREDKDRAPVLAGQHGVTCDPPRRRWFRWIPFARQCKVADWQEEAVQHVHLSSLLTCTATTMVMGLSGQLSQEERRDMHRTCLKVEQGLHVSGVDEERYLGRLGLVSDDHIVSSHLKVAFSIILFHGLASGLAGLRAATRGNERLPVLLEGAPALEPANYSAAFASFLAEENLTVRAEDRALYGDRALIQRTSTLHRLEVCEDVYMLMMQNTVEEGAKPLTIMALELWQHFLHSNGRFYPSPPELAPSFRPESFHYVIAFLISAYLSLFISVFSIAFLAIGLGAGLSFIGGAELLGGYMSFIFNGEFPALKFLGAYYAGWTTFLYRWFYSSWWNSGAELRMERCLKDE